jgi:hypothetical protein
VRRGCSRWRNAIVRWVFIRKRAKGVASPATTNTFLDCRSSAPCSLLELVCVTSLWSLGQQKARPLPCSENQRPPGEADVIEAQRTVAYGAALARSARRDIPVRVVANRIRRQTTLSRHLQAELDRLGLPTANHHQRGRAYGKMSCSGRLPEAGPAAEEAVFLMAELRGQGWLP